MVFMVLELAESILLRVCRENCEAKMDHFLERCFYHSGQYNSEDDFAELDYKLKAKEVIHVVVLIGVCSLFLHV